MSAPEHASRAEIAGWLAQLERSDTRDRAELLDRLWRLGPQDAVVPLLATLRDEASPLRALAARWLGHVGNGSAEVAAALSDALLSEDGQLREAASMAIGRVGYVDDTIRARLATLLRAESELGRTYAASSLLQLSANEPEALEVLRGARTSRSALVRNFAGDALASLHATIPSAIDDAIAFLDDDYHPTIEDVARGLGEAPPDVVIPRLLRVVRHGGAGAKAGALLCLREQGPKAHAYRDELTETLVWRAFPEMSARRIPRSLASPRTSLATPGSMRPRSSTGCG